MRFATGDIGPEVTEIQTLLNLLGAEVPITGVYDPPTVSAVKSWQSTLGLPVTGVWDDQTNLETAETFEVADGGTVHPPMIVPVAEQANSSADLDTILDRFSGTPEQRNALATLADVLTRYDLDSLIEWAWGRIVDGAEANEILVELREQPAFKQRFRMIQAVADSPLDLQPMSPADVIRYETEIRQTMRAAGFPPGFYDDPDDFVTMAANGLGTQEVQDRIQAVYDRVANADQVVRDQFATYFGIQGDVALAMLVVDPERSRAELDRMVAQSRIGASAKRVGIGLVQGIAEQIVGAEISEPEARAAFGRLDLNRDLFTETVTEDTDLEVETEGVQAELSLAPGVARMIEQRRLRRNARQQPGGGGAVTDTGVLGFGSATR